MKKATIALLLICTAIFAQQKGTFTDSRDGKKYKTVKIGSQTWMAENLNYNASGVCYDDYKPANCAKYGKLYDWETALKVCPSGWHLPSKSEWEILYKAVGGIKIAGKKLKAKSGWNENGNGTDEFGFSALPGGYGYANSDFEPVGYYGGWWSATEDYSNIVWYQSIYYSGSSVGGGSEYKDALFSVRCVRD